MGLRRLCQVSDLTSVGIKVMVHGSEREGSIKFSNWNIKQLNCELLIRSYRHLEIGLAAVSDRRFAELLSNLFAHRATAIVYS